eukprot:CAMPEP_0168755274 /NCGR_PEP_ID=MMETSP0724-20121128/19976_1 /TAXON_ID=265536 /ORGANISM="Amphiprora sp., Strain CCMP467" /LENGTH=180 /DNA_ID=CAMNT_0008803867 /DNA_START=284 /DNA_END=827 /DNA_ORIENTATION=-
MVLGSSAPSLRTTSSADLRDSSIDGGGGMEQDVLGYRQQRQGALRRFELLLQRISGTLRLMEVAAWNKTCWATDNNGRVSLTTVPAHRCRDNKTARNRARLEAIDSQDAANKQSSTDHESTASSDGTPALGIIMATAKDKRSTRRYLFCDALLQCATAIALYLDGHVVAFFVPCFQQKEV